ncbi:MAG: ATP-binding protein [Candidatus Aminicenantes bacterium]|nr:ATP-binding protein [Candidatus Aminicenantes bacterium]
MSFNGLARNLNLDQEGYFEGIMSSMTDALIVVNPDATLRSVNRAALDMLDYKEEELIGQPVETIILQEEGQRLTCFQNIFVTGVTFNMGLTFLTKQRKRIPVNISGAAIQQEGKIIGIVGVARDMRQIRTSISEWEEKKTEIEERGKKSVRMQRAMLHIMGDLDISNKEIGKANKELQKLDQLKSDFVSTVSHELRSPLTVTREAISQVLDGVCGEINEEQKQFLFMSIEGIDRLARLIENLLDISKIESHKIDLKRELVDIVSLAKEVSSSFAFAFQSKGLVAKYNFPKDKIELYVDKDRIIQIFVNLMSNAVKFTPAGYIEISIVDKENVVECFVSDTGIGISDEDLLKVFDKFEQFGREFECAEKGTGLGLAISKGNIELHRGLIWAESKLGQGTKISFTLPKYSPRELFKEYVTNGLAKAIKAGAPLSIIVFEVKYYDTLREKSGQDKIASIVHSLGQLIKTDLRRKSDISIKDSRAILVVLPETDKKCAWATADRLKSSFDDYLSKEGLVKDVEVDSRIASFPEDAQTEEELLNGVQLQENIEK